MVYVTNYRKLKSVLSKICTIRDINDTKRNQLIDFKINTEDTILVVKIEGLLACFNEVRRLKNIKMTMKCGNEFMRLSSLRDDLIEYCDRMLNSGKPEWMILAERNGWKPPTGL